MEKAFPPLGIYEAEVVDLVFFFFFLLRGGIARAVAGLKHCVILIRSATAGECRSTALFRFGQTIIAVKRTGSEDRFFLCVEDKYRPR